MPNFALFGSLIPRLHQEYVTFFYCLLPVFFSLALVFAWFRSPAGGPEFINVLRRTIIATILVVSFPEISKSILSVTEAIASRIDSVSGLDMVVKMAGEKSASYSASTTSLLIQFNDLIIALLSVLSYIFLYCARYLTIAGFHFFWTFLMVTSPLLILFYIFEGTAHITTNLFKGIIEIACWKIGWATLGAFLTALGFGDAYMTEGGYITLIVMNFFIGISMFSIPVFIHSLTGGGLASMGSNIASSATQAISSLPGQAMKAKQLVTSPMSSMQSISDRLKFSPSRPVSKPFDKSNGFNKKGKQ